jgi:hypothetical protein
MFASSRVLKRTVRIDQLSNTFIIRFSVTYVRKCLVNYKTLPYEKQQGLRLMSHNRRIFGTLSIQFSIAGAGEGAVGVSIG